VGGSPDSLGRATEFHLQPFNQNSGPWQELLSISPDATLYHDDAWIALLRRAYGYPLWLATLHRDGAVAAGCVFARVSASRRFISLPFSDTSPPLIRQPDDSRWLLDALAKHAPPHRFYEVRGIGGMAPWETVQCFANWRLELDRPLAQIEGALSTNFRRNLRRASQQAISIERGSSSDLLKRFYAMQLESRRRMGIPPQPWHFFKLVREIFVAENSFEVWIANEKGTDVASAVFLSHRDVIHYKWGARRPDHRSHANHLLFWNAIGDFTHRARVLDLGRADVRNEGLTRFKRELGASAIPLPSAFYPRAPRQTSGEVLTGAWAILAKVWRRLPIFATQLGGRALYRYLG
jgi:hypothetical protein